MFAMRPRSGVLAVLEAGFGERIAYPAYRPRDPARTKAVVNVAGPFGSNIRRNTDTPRDAAERRHCTRTPGLCGRSSP
jgi:hypothetical protein